ncbi:unnamed protein product, partial [Discosporangium mesarthrocarpum]
SGSGDKWPTCWYCHKRGHMAHACPTRACTLCGETGNGPSRCKQQEIIPAGYTATVVESNTSGTYTVLAATCPRDDGLDEWIADSGATWHMTNKATGMVDFVGTTSDTYVESANGDKFMVKGKGKLEVVFKDDSGIDIPATLHNVAYVPELKHNLFSFLAAAERGHTYVGTASGIEVSGGLTFVRRPGKGFASALVYYPPQTIAAATLTPGHFPSKSVDINLFHCSYAHAHEAALRKTARSMGVKLT